MTLQLQVETSPGGGYTNIDIAAFGIAQIKVTKSHAHPAMMSFVIYAPQQTMPLGINNFVRFWDDAAKDQNGNAFSAANPFYEGFIEDVSPGKDSNIVTVTCYDPTQKASQEIPVFSAPWQAGNPPMQPTTSVPRLMFNVSLQNDPDYSYSREEQLTVGNILATILDDVQPLLLEWNAGSGASSYVDGDVNAFTFVPQEKIAFESETITPAVQSMLRWIPGYKLFWYPGARQWRFLNLYAAPDYNITLNDLTGKYQILSFHLARSQKDRYTAVEVYGPQSSTDTLFSTADNSLTIINGKLLETYTDGGGTFNTYSVAGLQITDPNMRRIARLLNNPMIIGAVGQTAQTSRYPVLQFSPDGFIWQAVAYYSLDVVNGIVNLGSNEIYEQITPPYNPDSTQTIFVPTLWRFTAPVLADPLFIRVPSSGFSGTAFSIANVQRPKRLYDQMLAIGFDYYGTPLTSAQRLAAYKVYAQTLLTQHQDLIHTGGVVLDGLQYDFGFPYAALNIHAINGSGVTIPTGWEEIGAVLTDVEFNFSDFTTTLQFSTDQMELVGWDPETLKKELHIKAMEQRTVGNAMLTYGGPTTDFMSGKALPGQINGMTETISTYFIDPDNPRGPAQKAIR